MGDCEGTGALISGVGKGNGRTRAKAMAERGALVATNDVTPVNPDELARGSGGRIRSFVGDIASPAAGRSEHDPADTR